MTESRRFLKNLVKTSNPNSIQPLTSSVIGDDDITDRSIDPKKVNRGLLVTPETPKLEPDLETTSLDIIEVDGEV